MSANYAGKVYKKGNYTLWLQKVHTYNVTDETDKKINGFLSNQVLTMSLIH